MEMRIALRKQEQVQRLRAHGAQVVWHGGGEWIVEIEAEKYGVASFKLRNGTIFNPNEDYSDLIAEARRRP